MDWGIFWTILAQLSITIVVAIFFSIMIIVVLNAAREVKEKKDGEKIL